VTVVDKGCKTFELSLLSGGRLGFILSAATHANTFSFRVRSGVTRKLVAKEYEECSKVVIASDLATRWRCSFFYLEFAY
jgi:hypothetical protein